MDEVEAYAWYYLPDSHYRKNIGPVTFSDERFAKTKSMSPQQVAAGKLRAKELRSQIDAKLKRGGK